MATVFFVFKLSMFKLSVRVVRSMILQLWWLWSFRNVYELMAEVVVDSWWLRWRGGGHMCFAGYGLNWVAAAFMLETKATREMGS